MDVDELELRLPPVAVRVVPLQTRVTRAPLEVSGRFRAARAALIKAPSTGVVEDLELSMGDAVQAGATLLSVGRALARQRALSTEASLAQLGAQLAEREDALHLAEDRAEAAARLASLEAKARAVRCKMEHERLQKQRHALSEQASVVRAPFDARVAAVHTASGATVVTGNPLLELIAVDPILLELEVPTWVAGRCRPGASVDVRLSDDEPPRAGRLARWAPTALDDVRRVEIEVENADGRIAAGESALARLDVGERRALFAPRAALHRDDDGPSLRLVEHCKARVRPVRVLGGDERSVEVCGALSPSQLVVLHADRPLEEATEVVIAGDH